MEFPPPPRPEGGVGELRSHTDSNAPSPLPSEPVVRRPGSRRPRARRPRGPRTRPVLLHPRRRRDRRRRHGRPASDRLAASRSPASAPTWSRPRPTVRARRSLLAAAAAPIPFLLPRAGLLWSVPAVAPLLGTIALAPAFVGVAALATTPARRAGLAAAGLWWLVLAEVATGRALLLGAPDGVLPRANWEGSISAAASDALYPLATSPARSPPRWPGRRSPWRSPWWCEAAGSWWT